MTKPALDNHTALSAAQVAELRHYYYQMVLMRRFEERTNEMYVKAKIGGYCHLNLGEEATIVGLMAALKPEDYIFTNYREHGYILARGVAPGPIMAELFGRETGVSGGRGGSMHLFDVSKGFMGGYAIVGGQVPLAVGAAYALRYQEQPGVVVAQMGDASTNIGAFYESLNLAKLWKCPVLFFIVNNGYGMGSTVEMGSSEPDLWKKGASFRVHGEQVDGTDVLAVRDAVRRLRDHAEATGEPAILDVVSFRFRGHSVIDADRYRDAEEVRQGREQHDPLRHYATWLQDHALADDAWFATLAEQVEREVQEAIDFANAGPDPKIEDIFTYMYASPVPNTPGPEAARRLL
ncbi:pyruvate dehydrogenase (acetyl-transferring) E1 component subunit alpha [Candidatus Viridilinea mediisalina]|uniref:Pyruvate dehydrogenase E1 component subunit alpha n=1 Tax=Candidatus Viridilinea mediisalina TaxID=2024553 RepID=A0A2A6RDK5_9CHLR|nr:pyruvate dehydrogenase (acetyl-transferring) E1 component subunit alpha [Candidatus Viridilinea mediisalina]PDW00536.1 pyruvate dehydrogenase (acetyl-transferring) E1 component subunit alpha [Candidatus Viridilinea mediisalina]